MKSASGFLHVPSGATCPSHPNAPADPKQRRLTFVRKSLIDYMPSLLGTAIEFYSCFISYSNHDQEVADWFHAGIQNKGVRCFLVSNNFVHPFDLTMTEKHMGPIGAPATSH